MPDYEAMERDILAVADSGDYAMSELLDKHPLARVVDWWAVFSSIPPKHFLPLIGLRERSPRLSAAERARRHWWCDRPLTPTAGLDDDDTDIPF